jgi:hypothetical protein
MNASGYPPAGIYGTGTYRLILKDAEGVTLRDQDNVVLTEGLQPDADGNYVMPENLDVQGTLTINGVLVTGDGLGNMAYNGAAIPINLDPDITYEFWERSCLMKKSATGEVWSCTNVYLEVGSVWKSMQNSGALVSFHRLNTTSFIIRASTLNSNAIGQTMIMTTPIVPS